MSMTFDTSDFEFHIKKLQEDVQEAGIRALQDCAEDLVRISSQIAPIDKNILRKSWTIHAVKVTATGIRQDVSYNATEKSAGYGRFNYALWTHEAEYMPSQPLGGTDGYIVGSKYLQRPLYGESEKYFNWIAEEVREGVGG
jgi:hypothetical protein